MTENQRRENKMSSQLQQEQEMSKRTTLIKRRWSEGSFTLNESKCESDLTNNICYPINSMFVHQGCKHQNLVDVNSKCKYKSTLLWIKRVTQMCSPWTNRSVLPPLKLSVKVRVILNSKSKRQIYFARFTFMLLCF